MFRLVAADTVEQHILTRAKAKRQLEAVVIEKGRFRRPITHASMYEDHGESNDDPASDDALTLHTLQPPSGPKGGGDVISDADLDRLLDRTDAAYERHIGWQSHANDTNTLFEVTETNASGSNEQLSNLLGADAD